MGTLITVNNKFPLFSNNIQNLLNQDGCIFEALEEESGYFLTIFLNKPNEKEIEIFSKEAEIRLFENDEHILPLIRFGGTQFLFEMDFDPTLYNDGRAFQFKTTNNSIQIALVDSTDFTVKALRCGNLPLKMIQRCSKKWARACLEPEYSTKHRYWYQSIQNNFDLEKVWNSSVEAGFIGDFYNLDELTY